jgi:hypothetical protein
MLWPLGFAYNPDNSLETFCRETELDKDNEKSAYAYFYLTTEWQRYENGPNSCREVEWKNESCIMLSFNKLEQTFYWNQPTRTVEIIKCISKLKRRRKHGSRK